MAGKYDSMSFKQAFAAARKAAGGDGGKFTWQGKSYTTNTAKTSAPSTSPRPAAKPAAPAAKAGVAKAKAAGAAQVAKTVAAQKAIDAKAQERMKAAYAQGAANAAKLKSGMAKGGSVKKKGC